MDYAKFIVSNQKKESISSEIVYDYFLSVNPMPAKALIASLHINPVLTNWIFQLLWIQLTS